MDDKIETSNNIKNLIEKEKDNLNNSLKDVIEQIEQFYNKIIKELETKVKETNDKLNKYFEIYNKEIELSKKINEEAKLFNYEEKNNHKLISYIYKLNKTCEMMDDLMSEHIYSLKYTFDINNKVVVYEEPKINNIKKYSYLCINRNSLNSHITKGKENLSIEIILKNDGKVDWLPNAKLVFDNNSQIKEDDIILNAQKCNEEQTYKINFNNLSNLNIGKYECYLWFNINGENFGDKISLKITVYERDDNFSMIDIFRESFDLSKTDFSDNLLLEVLKRADNDMELAFSYLYGP